MAMDNAFQPILVAQAETAPLAAPIANPAASPAIAQPAGDAASRATPALPGDGGWLPTLDGLRDNVASLFSLGGPVVVFLALLSIIALALVLLKIVQFFLLRVGRHRRAERALAAWRRGDREVALGLAEECRNPVADTVAHAMRGLMRPGVSEARVREDAERVAEGHLAHLTAYLRPLELIAQIAPLIGLFGTVIGMIDAFHAMQGAGANVDPSVLAGGIWVALLTTAVGLAIAIPASMALSWLDGRVARERGAIEQSLSGLFAGWATESEAVAPLRGSPTLIRVGGDAS